MRNLPLSLLMLLSLMGASMPVAAAAPGDASALVSQKWRCAVSSPMQGDLNYRIYTGGGFDAVFIFALKPEDGNRIGGVIVAEKWTSGAQTLAEFSVSGYTGTDQQNRPAVLVERMTVTRNKGDQKVWPSFYQASLNYTPDGGVRAEVDVGRGGDVAHGRCAPY